MSNRVILDSQLMHLTLERLCYELFENYGDFSNTVLIGIQPRGSLLAARISAQLETLIGHSVPFGKIDITFHRDDFRRSGKHFQASETEMDFIIEGKNVILVDDVLYTGRTVRAAMEAMLSFGRPAHVDLLVLIDRRFNRELPIQADFVGKTVDTIEKVNVKVHWADDEHPDCVLLLKENA